MDIDTYQKIYTFIQNKEDVIQVSKDNSLPSGIISAILDQKVIAQVKKNYHKVKNSKKHLSLWNKGFNIIEIAKNNNIPSTLMASMILKEMGYPKQIFKNINSISDCRLKAELEEVFKSDVFFSPFAQKMKDKKGRLGEKLIQNWLLDQNIPFFTESELRTTLAKKTPDFLLKESIEINNIKVSWIESKAMFGSDSIHEYYLKRQFNEYKKLYGAGMVVYWYGFIEYLSFKQNLIKDYKFFFNSENKKEIDCLLNWI